MTASVLVVCGHVGIEQMTAEGLRPCRDVTELRRGTGSRGEREWTGNAGPLLAAALRARDVDAVVTNSIYDEQLYGRVWDLVLVLHLQRDRASARAFAAFPAAAGVCDGAPYLSAAARIKSQWWLNRFNNEYTEGTGIPVTPEAITDRMTQNYIWDYPTMESPCVLPELAHMDIDAPVLYEPGIARIVTTLAKITLEYLEADLGLRVSPVVAPPPAAIIEPFPLSTFPVAGAWTHDVAALESAVQRYSEDRAPAGWARQLAFIAAEAGIRADVAAAQAMHETGRFRFDGPDPVFSAKPEWFNYGGIKTRDGTATAHFASMFLGIRALVAHMAAYALPDHPTSWCAEADPRHDWVPHTNPPKLVTLADYGGGVWNTSPRPQYGSAVARHLAELRSLIAQYVPPATRRDDKAIAAELRAIAAELERERVA